MNLVINNLIIFSCLLSFYKNIGPNTCFYKNVIGISATLEFPIKIPPIPEGTIIQRAEGQLKEKNGGWIFVLEKEFSTGKKASRTCPVFPSRTIEMFEKRIKKDPLLKTIPLRITGELFVYRGRNFIDIITIEISKKPRSINTPTDAPVDINNDLINGGATRELQEKAPSIDEVMKALDRAIPVVGKSGQESIVDSKDEIRAPQKRIFFRRAKLTRDQNGLWKLVFTGDQYGHSDPPASILPTTQLMSLQSSRLPTQTELLISGKRRRYHKKDYFLLEHWRKPVGTSHVRP